jgi:hypothetical protein
MIKSKILLFVALTVTALNAQASKVFLALVPTNGPLHAVVTVMEKPCTSTQVNALYLIGKAASMGCWKLDGKQVKVEWQSGDAPTVFEYDAFKMVGDDGDTAIASESKKGSVTHLNCTAQGWVGDLAVERDETGILKKLTVGGEEVSFSEKGTSVNFSYQGKNISLSTTTGIFNFETSNFQSYLNSRLLGVQNDKGTGSCKLSDGKKKF